MDSQETLDSILNSVADPIFIKDREHRWLLMNDAMCTFMGRRREEIIGKSDYDFFPKAEADVFWAKDEEVFLSRESNTNEESLTDAEGVQHVITTKKSLGRSASGQEFLVGIIHDLTERQRAEAALREHHSILNGFYESVPFMMGIVEVVNGDIHLLSANDATVKFMRKSAEELKQFWVRELALPAALVQEWIGHYQESERTGRPVRFEYSQPTPEGPRILSVTICFIIRPPNGHSRFSYVTEDVTEIKKMEQVMRQSEKMSAMGQLAAGVAHEINNPLGVILGFAQSLARRLQEPADVVKAISSIEREAKRCHHFVKNMLVFARQSPTGATEEDPIVVVEESLALIEARARLQRVDVVRDYPSEHFVFRMDRNQIQQVVINLCFNAIDVMPRGGTLLFRLRMFPEKGFEIQVRDSGAGIPPEIQERIFEPFFTTKDAEHGTGLGLSIVNEIVKKLEGTIVFESRLGHGTTFTVTFPSLARLPTPAV